MMNIILLIVSFFFMEFVAWSNHKYIMHGFLWKWHKGHHVNDIKRPSNKVQEDNGFEKNDLFFLIYAIPAIILMLFGISHSISSLVYVSVGITLYGFTYFILHDVIYHKRIRLRFLQNSKIPYIRAVFKAHEAHHKPKNAADFESYGLLFFPKRFLKAKS